MVEQQTPAIRVITEKTATEFTVHPTAGHRVPENDGLDEPGWAYQNFYQLHGCETHRVPLGYNESEA